MLPLFSPADVHDILDVTLAVLFSEILWLVLVHGTATLWRRWKRARRDGGR